MLEIEIMNFDIVGKNEVKDCLWEWVEIDVKKLTAQLLDELKNKWRINWIRNITMLWVLMKLQTHDTINGDWQCQKMLKLPYNCT